MISALSHRNSTSTFIPYSAPSWFDSQSISKAYSLSYTSAQPQAKSTADRIEEITPALTPYSAVSPFSVGWCLEQEELVGIFSAD